MMKVFPYQDELIAIAKFTTDKLGKQGNLITETKRLQVLADGMSKLLHHALEVKPSSDRIKLHAQLIARDVLGDLQDMEKIKVAPEDKRRFIRGIVYGVIRIALKFTLVSGKLEPIKPPSESEVDIDELNQIISPVVEDDIKGEGGGISPYE